VPGHVQKARNCGQRWDASGQVDPDGKPHPWHEPAQPVVLQKMGKDGKLKKWTDRLGGVFAPVPGKAQRPVYTAAGEGAKEPLLLFTCPTSAIPTDVWDLLHLWIGCRTLRLPPVAGGFLDQPKLVQAAFPIFESLMQAQEANRAQAGTAAAMAGAVATVFGGGR
jgi:hypothetical protein